MKKMRDSKKDAHANITFGEYVSTMKQNTFVTSDDTEDVVRSSAKSFGGIRLAQNAIDEEIVSKHFSFYFI